MSIQAPQGILNIPNATLRVGKLAVDEVVGADTILNTVARNTILLVDDVAYHENKNWALKLPNAWAGEFECNTASAGNYSEFNFYNEGASSNAQGYNLTFNDTTVELRYDGSLLTSGTLASTVTGTGVRKVRLMFERTILSVTVDGVLVFTHDDTGGPRPRVYSTTAGGFLNFFTDGGALKNLKIVNEKWMSDGTSNIAYVGGGEVAVGQALAFNRVSNVSQIKVDSNVVTEYTGPHDRPLRKYPEVAMTANDNSSTSGYVVDKSEESSSGDAYAAYRAFDGIIPDGTTTIGWRTDSGYNQDTGLADGGVTRFTGDSGEWVELQLPNSIKLSSIVLKVGNQGNNLANSQRRFPKVFVIYGYNGTSWDRIQEYTTSAIQSLTDVQTFHISNPTAYHNKFVLVVKQTYSVTGATSGVTNIGELEYYGYEEGSGSLDTTLKTVYNVPATTGTQLEVYYDAKDLADGALSTTSGAITGLGGTTINGTAFGDPQVSNGAFVFDGTGDYIETSTVLPSTFIDDVQHSIGMWFKVNTNDLEQTLMMIHNGGNNTNQSPHIVISTAGILRYDFFSNDIQLLDQIALNQWYHLMITFSGGNHASGTKIYINGVHNTNVSTPSSTATLDIQSSSLLTIGGRLNGTQLVAGSIANFRLYSKALNADQVKELYDYQKDYFLGSKSQVTLYKGHLGVGVTEPSSQLELAGDERLQEYPPGPMGPSTSYETHIPGHGVFCWDTVNYYSGSPVENFNGSGMYAKDGATTGWYGPYNNNNGYTGGNVYAGTDFAATSSSGLGFNDAYGNRYYGAWTTFKLPYKINLKKIHIDQFATSDGANARCAPEDGVILGSNNGVDWYHVHTFIGLQYGGSAGNPSYSAAGEDVTITCTTDYSQYALVITRTLHYDFTALIGELKWFGTPSSTTLDKGSLSLTRSLDVPRISRYDVDTETPRPEKLVVDFDTTVNSSPTDISGKGNHGTFVNGASYSPADKAFVFDGTDDYIKLDTGLTGNVVHSISMWVKAVADFDTGNIDVVLYWGAGGSGSHRVEVYMADDIISYNFASNDYNVTLPTNTLVNDRWYHLVFTYNGVGGASGREVYIDGVKQTGSHTGSTDVLTLANSDLYLASNFSPGGQYHFGGQISNFKLYNVALEPSEVKKLYNLGRTGRSMVISDTAVGIGKVPEAQLDVRGVIKGINMTSSPAAFSVAYNPTSLSGNQTIIWNLVYHNVGDGYNSSDGFFTAPVSGYYHFTVWGMTSGTASGTVEFQFRKNGSVVQQRPYGNAGGNYGNATGSIIEYLNIGNTMSIFLTDGTTLYASTGQSYNGFSGFYLSS